MTDAANGKAGSDLTRVRHEVNEAVRKALAEERWSGWRPLVDIPALIIFVVAMTALIAPPGPRMHPVPAADAVAPVTIRSERDLLVEDKRATEFRRKAASDAVRPIFDYDSELYFALGDRVSHAVREMRRRRDAKALSPAERRQAFETDLGAPVAPRIFELIEAIEEPQELAVAINFFLNMGLERMIVVDREVLPREGGIDVHDLSRGDKAPLFHFGAVLDLHNIERLMTARAGDAPYGSARQVRSWILETAIALASANLTANAEATAAARAAAARDIEPVFVRIQAGEVLVRQGDRVTAQIQERIRMLNLRAAGRTVWGETIAVAALMSGLILLAGLFFHRSRTPLPFSRKSAYLTLSIVGVCAALDVAMIYAGRGLAEGLGINPGAVAYFLPVGLATVMISLLVDARTSLLAGVILCMLIAQRVDSGLWFVTYAIVGVLIAGSVARYCRHRSDLLRTGLAIAGVQALVVPIVATLSGESFGTVHLPYVAAAIISGLLVAVCALSLLPVFEYIFDEATDLRLLELASTDHPLLRKLALHAPGTYYASVIVGNLAEAAAEAVGANGLKARVMALYHDIGKIERPNYFAENQREGNVHDRLPPDLSACIVFGHVRDGLQIAHQAKLGRPILEAIAQHQGTALLRPFYLKAMEQAAPSGAEVREEDYRYPGPKPSSREAGILLLADSVEAATRALTNPAPADVKQRVNEIVEQKVADGQLDNCELTLKDLAAIENAFLRVLTLGVFHSRIEYPPMPDRRGGESKHVGHRRVDSIRRLAERSPRG